MHHQFTTSYWLNMWSSSNDSQWSKSLKTLKWCMSCVWIDLLSWVCELEREKSRENKEKCVVNCWRIITSSQSNDGIYSMGEWGEEEHKIPNVRASRNLLLKWLTHKLLVRLPIITKFRISSMCSSHDLLEVLQSRANHKIPWLVQFFTNCRLSH